MEQEQDEQKGNIEHLQKTYAVRVRTSKYINNQKHQRTTI